MAVNSPESLAEENLAQLGKMENPGHVLVLGRVGEIAVFGYAVEDHSELVRNRVAVQRGSEMYIEVQNPDKAIDDPELASYKVMGSNLEGNFAYCL